MYFSLNDCILDLVQNSIEAEATQIDLFLNQSVERFIVKINDNGYGMNNEELKMAADPFYTNGMKHKHRKVGLGIPFLLQTVSMTDGKINIQSDKGKGTSIDIEFNLTNIDTPPVGNLISMIYQVMCFDGNYNLKVQRMLSNKRKDNSYTIERKEIKDILGNLHSITSISLLRDFITSQENELETGDR